MRGFSFEAQQDGAIATVSSPGGSQRPVQVDLDAFDLQQQPVSGQSLGKLAGSLHGADGVRARGANTDFENVENASGHRVEVVRVDDAP
jgi:hypothetical protein